MVAYLTVNVDAFGVFNVDQKRKDAREGKRGMSGGALQHMMLHGRLQRGVNLGANVSRRETSLVRRIDYAEDADKGRRGAVRDACNDPARHKRQRRVNTRRIIDRKSGRDVFATYN